MADSAVYLGFGGREVDNPDWDNAGRVHDWRNYVGEYTKAIWQTFTHEQRTAIAQDASTRASDEDWD